MIRYAAMVFILIGSYYTLTFGKSLWKDDKNKLGGVGAAVLSLSSIAAFVYFLIINVG